MLNLSDGIWEKLVQSCRIVLIATLNNHYPTDKEISAREQLVTTQKIRQPSHPVISYYDRKTQVQHSCHSLKQPWTEKTLQSGSSIWWHDLGKMNSRLTAATESKIEVVKTTCAKSQRTRAKLVVWWIIQKDNVSMKWNSLSNFFKGDDDDVRSAIVKMALGEFIDR